MKRVLHLGLTLCAGVSAVACSQQGRAPEVSQRESAGLAEIPTNPDTRIIVSLTAQQRLHVLEEMNQFLLSTQEIVEGLSSDDPELVQSAVADSLGRNQGQSQGQGLMKGALPSEFRQMGSAMKQEFKKVETLSKSGADSAQILEQLSSTLMYCQSCHGTYQIHLTEAP
ncbi:hypothetical protein [Fretibacter rubidus]|uniref:hypothetical protein n=1 Tax=Fretibacter rubidus TaxID=570162 RepID=UPI00352A51AB